MQGPTRGSSARGRGRLRGLVVTGALVGVVTAVAVGASPVAAADTATVFVVQGLPDQTVDVAVDGRKVAGSLAGASLSDALSVESGRRTLTFSSGGATIAEKTVDVTAGSSTDVVLHLPVDPTGDPVVTTFDNTTATVPADKASLTVTHTAAVPPADIRVDGKVLFANVANGESLNLVVPTGSYSVDVVPTGETAPVVLGPLDLTVQGGSLNRVFAVGDPASSDMRVVVQVISARGAASPVPSRVDSGTGGQATGRAPVLRSVLGVSPSR